MGLTIQRVDPLLWDRQIKTLFLESERSNFSDKFDRAYPVAVAKGAASWVAVAEGRVVVHVGCFPVHLSHDGHLLSGALLVDLMADKAYRTFFPVVSTLRALVRDQAGAGVDVVYTNPRNPGAVSAMRAAGLAVIGGMNRFLLLTGHRSALIDVVIASWLQSFRLATRRVVAIDVPLEEAVRWTTQTRCEVSAVTPVRSQDLYAMQMEGFGGAEDIGYRFVGRGTTTEGGAVVRLPRDGDEATLVTLRCRRADVIPGAVSALGSALRRRGVRRLDGSALVGTTLAQRLTRGGFLQRKEPCAVVAAGLTPSGKRALAGLAQSDLEAIDLD